jgi:hypothetical protein
MSGWSVLIWGVTCALGVLLFLKAVADGIENAQVALDLLEKRQCDAYRKQMGSGEED